MCHAQGHSAAMPVRLEPAALLSQVKHSITEPLRSNLDLVDINAYIKFGESLSVCSKDIEWKQNMDNPNKV